MSDVSTFYCPSCGKEEVEATYVAATEQAYTWDFECKNCGAGGQITLKFGKHS